MLPIVAVRSSVATSTIRLMPPRIASSSSSSSSSILSSMMKTPRLASSMSTSTRWMKNQSMPKMMRWNAITATPLQRSSASSSSMHSRSSIASFYSMASTAATATSVTSIRSLPPIINRVGSVAEISSQTLLAPSSPVTPPSSSDKSAPSESSSTAPASSASSSSADLSLSAHEFAVVGIVCALVLFALAFTFPHSSMIFGLSFFFIFALMYYLVLPVFVVCVIVGLLISLSEGWKNPDEKEKEARAIIQAADAKRQAKAKEANKSAAKTE